MSTQITVHPAVIDYLNTPQDLSPEPEAVVLTKPEAVLLARGGELNKAIRFELCGTRGHIRYCSGPDRHAIAWEGHGCGLRICPICKHQIARDRFTDWEDRLHEISNLPGKLLLVDIWQRQKERFNPLEQVNNDFTSIICDRGVLVPHYFLNLVGWEGNIVHYRLLCLDLESENPVEGIVRHTELAGSDSWSIWNSWAFDRCVVKTTTFDTRNYKDVATAFKRLVAPMPNVDIPEDLVEQELLFGHRGRIFRSYGISQSKPLEVLEDVWDNAEEAQDHPAESSDLSVGQGSITDNAAAPPQVDENKDNKDKQIHPPCPHCGHICNVIGSEVAVGSPEYLLLRARLPRHVF